jgi:hypothetical protein
MQMARLQSGSSQPLAQRCSDQRSASRPPSNKNPPYLKGRRSPPTARHRATFLTKSERAAALGPIEACLADHPEMCINASLASAVASVQLSASNWKLPALPRLATATEGNGEGCSMQ